MCRKMCVCSVCVCKSMFVSVKYIYEQSGKTTMLGNVIVMGYKICMVRETANPTFQHNGYDKVDQNQIMDHKRGTKRQ